MLQHLKCLRTPPGVCKHCCRRAGSALDRRKAAAVHVRLQIQLHELSWEKWAERVSPCYKHKAVTSVFQKGSASAGRGGEGMESERSSARGRRAQGQELCARFFQHPQTFKCEDPLCCCSEDVWQKIGINMDRPCLEFRRPFSAAASAIGIRFFACCIYAGILG